MTALLSNARRRAALLLGALALAGTAGLAHPTPAAAAEWDCDGYTMCLFSDSNYGGTLLRWNYQPSGTLSSHHDITSSIVNNSGSAYCFYEHPDYGGLQFRIGPWERWASVPYWINDRISSLHPC
ncbi:peptidase inhibitor family I36 protein [Streptomyces sp. NPDC048290]|uniref:peptidase inhibitor family I36 protein n=1 Tax=Streptomyces sp. NPDC048290 TaxID=3155811 RepID=UPI00341295A5